MLEKVKCRHGGSSKVPMRERTEVAGDAWKIKVMEDMVSTSKYFKMATLTKDKTYTAETQRDQYVRTSN